MRENLDALSKSEFDTLVREALAYNDVLRRAVTTCVDALQPGPDGHDHTGRERKLSTTDGPFAKRRSSWAGSS